MRILHILDHSIPLHSGYTFRTRNILRYQRELGWETCHITGSKHLGAKSQEEVIDGLHFYRTSAPSHLMGRIPVLKQIQVINSLARRIEEVIEKEQPDILHAHSPALNGLAALKANRKYGLPVVYECRAFWEDAAADHGTSKEWGPRYRLTRAVETRVFQKVDAITTICEGLRRDICARGISEEKITVIPNAVDTGHFAYDAKPDNQLQKKLDLQDEIVLGFIGSFYAYEGLPLLLDAMPQLLRSHPRIRLLLVGGGPQEALIRERVEQLQLEEQVIMIGRVPHGEVQNYYNLVHIFVYPRLPMRLTELVTPLKPLEAMAQGRLVVASDVGGQKELIRDGENGLLFKAGDRDDLAAVVSALIATTDIWPTLRHNARHYVEDVRNWQNSVAQYKSVYGIGL